MPRKLDYGISDSSFSIEQYSLFLNRADQIMNTLIIDRKKYVVVEQREYYKLLEKAAEKKPVARKLTLVAGKKLAYKLIGHWHKGK